MNLAFSVPAQPDPPATKKRPKQSQTTKSNKPDNKQQTRQQRQQAPPTQHQMVLCYTPDEMLQMGLEVAGFNDL